MKKLSGSNLKLAVQKTGRLTTDTLGFLQAAGLDFDAYKQQLYAHCRNFPLEILYVRDDDIADYVESGIADLGIVGKNILVEDESEVDSLVELGFGYCNLTIGVPKESGIENVNELNGKKIATCYPNTTRKFFSEQGVSVEIMPLSGSVEIAPLLGVADAISDMTSTGSTMAMNDLIPLQRILESEAVLIANTSLSTERMDVINRLLIRFRGVLAGKKYKYIMMNAPEDQLENIIKVVPGLKSPTISALAMKGWISVQCVVKEDVFWDTMEELQKLGAAGIIVLPIEKVIE